MTWFKPSMLFIAAVSVVAAAAPLAAAETRNFDPAVFAAAQQAGRPVLVEVAASWCPVCVSQGRTIKAAIVDPAYEKLLVLRLDYDGQKAEWRNLGVKKQATLIGFSGKREVGRIEFQTDKQQIASLIAATVQ